MISRARVIAFLKNPYADKVLGLVAMTPVFYTLFQFWELVVAGTANIFSGAIAAGGVVIIVSVIIRRTAKRVSLNPLFWFITAARNYWAFIFLEYIGLMPTQSLVPMSVINTLFLVSMIIIIYARFSLGRNLGFIPARRELVTTGAYAWVRHPIHTGDLLFLLSFFLAGFSVFNWSMLLLAVAFIIWKTVIEEEFLNEDADYRAYCKKVPYRFIPGIV